MSSLTILINYDGKWVNSKYKNCKTKGLLVSDKITVEELRNKVYDIVNVDRNKYEIIMKVIYNAMKSAWPAEIVDDDDMRAFIFESLSRTYKIPLCITLKRKIFSCGSNQPMPMDLNLGTQVDLEDNDQYHDSENDLGNAEIEDLEYEEQIFNVDSKMGDYLNAVGYEKWARAHFNGKRYNLMTTNIAECLNSITRDARKLPITNFMEYLRMNILQKWFHECRTEAAKMDSHLTEWADNLVRENNKKGLSLQVFQIH